MSDTVATGPFLAFFRAIKRRDAHLGGLLVLDTVGLPVQFFHTNPIRPNLLQKLAMGVKEDSFMQTRNILPNLLKEVDSQTQLILVKDRHTYEGAQGAGLSIPVMLMSEGTGDPLPNPGDVEPLEDGSSRVQLYDVGPPQHLLSDQLTQHLELLKAYARHADFSEAFHRLDHLLQAVFDDTAHRE
jgi:hypothetical protein